MAQRQVLRAAILIVACLGVAGCVQELVPPERTAIFPKDNAKALLGLCYHEPSGITGYWTPGAADLAGVEDRLNDFLCSLPERRGSPGEDWAAYYRQVAGIEIGGQRYLFISYAWCPLMHDARYIADQKREIEAQGRPYDPDWWKKHPIVVMDGGSWFFRVVYDPRTKQFVWYEQNGNA